MIKKEGSKYVVYDSKGKKKLGSHPTKKQAQAQIAAREISKHKRGKKINAARMNFY